jgi:hypothetical protein
VSGFSRTRTPLVRLKADTTSWVVRQGGDGSRRHDHEPRIDGADERDEQADAGADGAPQIDWNGSHHRFARADQHERQDREPSTTTRPIAACHDPVARTS